VYFDNINIIARATMSEKAEENVETTQQPGTDAGERCEQSAGEAEDLQAKIAKLEDAKKTLEEENLALKDQYIRTRADTDNFRKRILREKQEAIQFANRQLLTDILPVLDDFERAVKSAEASRDFTVFYDGILMIEKQLCDLLERKWGLKRFDSVGEEFDPQRHEALYSEERPEHTVSRVLEDYMTGYTLYDKVLRAAKVKVSMPAADGAGSQDENKNAETPEKPESEA
jgi:molecular chaperone GrpE